MPRKQVLFATSHVVSDWKQHRQRANDW